MDSEEDRDPLILENERLRQENDDLKVILGLVKENLDLRSKLHKSSAGLTVLHNDTVEEPTGHDSLLLENERLRQENDDLKVTMGLVKENLDLRTKVHNSSLTNDTVKEPTGGKTTIQCHDTLDESRFRKDLNPSDAKTTHRTSSPIKKAFTKSPVCTDPRGQEELASCSQSHLSKTVKDPETLVGEIAFQLDRRILSHVFQGQTRLYGFTVSNIPDKIIQVSTHPLTGEVDEGHRLELSRRHTELMDRLIELGYSISLHPPFTEFIVNTYGILKHRPDSNRAQEQGFNNPDLLWSVVNTAPDKLQKDLLLLINCLCFMARLDGKPLLLW